MNEPISAPDIQRLIHTVRDQRVMLDSDLAALYGVTIKRLNEQYRRNKERFPEDFAFKLTPEEWAALRSQSATLETGRGRHRKYLPITFTEHGALMAANVLNSPRSVAMSVYVIRAFVKMREDLATNAAILKHLAEIDKTLLVHDAALREIWERLQPLLAPPPAPPKPQIGFHVREDVVPYRITRKPRPREARGQG